MPQKVIIETSECLGCESCVELCLEVFGMDKETGKAFVRMPMGGPKKRIKNALKACPVGCIHWK